MKKRQFRFFFFALTMLIIFSPGCQPDADYPELSLEPSENADNNNGESELSQEDMSSPSPLRLAIAPVVSPPKTREYYQELLTYLPEKLDRPIELELRSTYSEVNQLIEQGEVDAALICTWSYVELKDDGYIDLLVIPQIKGQTRYHSHIIVPTGSPFAGLEDLHQEKFAFTDPLSFSGRLYVLSRLQQMNETPGTFFQDYIFTYSHDNSVFAVAEGLVKAASVDSLVYDYLVELDVSLGEKIMVIESSPPVGNPPLVVGANIDPDLRQQLKDIFLTMHNDEAGQKALAEMRVERFVEGADKEYDYIRDILETKEGTTD